jgi:hypothetical protein
MQSDCEWGKRGWFDFIDFFLQLILGGTGMVMCAGGGIELSARAKLLKLWLDYHTSWREVFFVEFFLLCECWRSRQGWMSEQHKTR